SFRITGGQLQQGSLCSYHFAENVTSGRFFSPNFPRPYPAGLRCVYQFRALLKHVVMVTFERVELREPETRAAG
ncbi:hypothetical protein Ciccas_013983, partial [Cichlidogyrus casuarinus]